MFINFQLYIPLFDFQAHYSTRSIFIGVFAILYFLKTKGVFVLQLIDIIHKLIKCFVAAINK